MGPKDFATLVPAEYSRPDVEMALPKMLFIIGELVNKSGDTRVFSPIDLNTIKYMLLHILDHNEAKPTMTELQQALLRSPANLTQLVDDMESSGLIRRVPSPSDRRVKLIELTETGRDKTKEAEDRMAMIMKILLEEMPDSMLKPMVEGLIWLGNRMLAVVRSGESLLGDEGIEQ